MLSGPNVILTLKIAVVTATLLFAASLLALARGNQRLHGRINWVFFALTVSALIGLEVVARLVNPELFDYFDADPDLKRALIVHLCFSLPSAALMPVMLWTGTTHRRTAHVFLAGCFTVCWVGTFITGVFFLPHAPR